jgi:hypothetical protein
MATEVKDFYIPSTKLWQVGDNQLMEYVVRRVQENYEETESDKLLNDSLAMAAQRAPRYRNRVDSVMARIRVDHRDDYHNLLWETPRKQSHQALDMLRALIAEREASTAGLTGSLVRQGLITKNYLNAEGRINTEALKWGFVGGVFDQAEADPITFQKRRAYFKENSPVLRALDRFTISKRNPWRQQLIAEAKVVQLIPEVAEVKTQTPVSLQAVRLGIRSRLDAMVNGGQRAFDNLRGLVQIPATAVFH